MAGENSYNPQRNQASQLNAAMQNTSNRGFFSRILRDLSSWNWGMRYDHMVIKNSVAIGVNEDPNQIMASDSMYDLFSRKAVAKILEKKSSAYLDYAYPEKRKILRQYALKDEIKYFVTIVSDDAIDYDEDNRFCYPLDLKENVQKNIRDRYYEIFDQVYTALGFGDGITAYNYFKMFLVDGYLAFEIVYDDRMKNIIEVKYLDPTTLVPAVEPMSGKQVWIQFPDSPMLRRVLLDSQIIYISYRGNNAINIFETSYVENLIRPYNQLKLIEQTRIMFNIANATIHQKFIIPVGGLSKQRAEEEISQLIADYREEVTFDDEMGTVRINGSTNVPYTKQWWFPESEQGKPDVEIVNPEGVNLNESDMLTWFFNALKRASQVPFTRMDTTTGGGNIFNDAAEVTRDEIRFNNFINRLQSVFKEVVVKPLIIQTLLEFPELRFDNNFINQINIRFNTNNMFEEWKGLGILEKRAAILSTLLQVPKDSSQSIFDIDVLVKEILRMTDKQMEEHRMAKTKKGEAILPAAGGGEMGPEGGGGEEIGTELPEGGGETGGELPPPPAEEGGGGAEEAV